MIRNEKGTGMIEFNDNLAELVASGDRFLKEALLASPNPEELRMRMRGIKTSVTCARPLPGSSKGDLSRRVRLNLFTFPGIIHHRNIHRNL